MKKFSLLILTILFYVGVNAQTDSMNNSLNPPQSAYKSDKTITHHADGYMMKNGKMVIVKNGQVTTMESDVTLPDGTVIMRNGSYEKKNGIKKVLREGEHVNMMGDIIQMNSAKNSSENQNLKSKKNKDMILVPDSTRKKKTW